MRNREYVPNERIIDRVVEMWIRALSSPKYDNGDTSASGGFSMVLASLIPKNNDPDHLRAFGVALKELLMNKFACDKEPHENEPYTTWIRNLSVDYAPDMVLFRAAKIADLKMEFPWKTNMSFYGDCIYFAQGYGALGIYHYPLSGDRWLLTTLHGEKEDISAFIRFVESGVVPFGQMPFIRIEHPKEATE